LLGAEGKRNIVFPEMKSEDTTHYCTDVQCSFPKTESELYLCRKENAINLKFLHPCKLLSLVPGKEWKTHQQIIIIIIIKRVDEKRRE